MFLLNADRYVIADPEILLEKDTLKKLWGAKTRLGTYILESKNGILLALPTQKNGLFLTDIEKPIYTASAHIAFIPYRACEKLLKPEVIRISLETPTLLFFNEKGDIVLDRKLTIFVNYINNH